MDLRNKEFLGIIVPNNKYGSSTTINNVSVADPISESKLTSNISNSYIKERLKTSDIQVYANVKQLNDDKDDDDDLPGPIIDPDIYSLTPMDTEGTSRYLVHIPELMPFIQKDQGIWCYNGLISIRTIQCFKTEKEIATAADTFSNCVELGSVSSTSNFSQVSTSSTNSIIKSIGSYTPLFPNIVVYVKFIQNDLNSGHIVRVTPFDSETFKSVSKSSTLNASNISVLNALGSSSNIKKLGTCKCGNDLEDYHIITDYIDIDNYIIVNLQNKVLKSYSLSRLLQVNSNLSYRLRNVKILNPGSEKECGIFKRIFNIDLVKYEYGNNWKPDMTYPARYYVFPNLEFTDSFTGLYYDKNSKLKIPEDNNTDWLKLSSFKTGKWVNVVADYIPDPPSDISVYIKERLNKNNDQIWANVNDG